MLLETLRYQCDEMAMAATCAVGRFMTFFFFFFFLTCWFMTFQSGACILKIDTTCEGDRSWESVSQTVGFTYLTSKIAMVFFFFFF
jgi:uncharacterized protein (DUF2062 family)